MRAAQCTGYGENFEQILSVSQDGTVDTPRLGIDKPPAAFKDEMLIKIQAVALAPGDARVMSGLTRESGPSFISLHPWRRCLWHCSGNPQRDEEGRSVQVSCR